jgi:hypothetical protein
MALSPATGRLFVSDSGLAAAFVIEPDGTVLPGTIALGTAGDDSPALLAFDPSGADAWVADFTGPSPTTTAWSVDASTLTATPSPAAIQSTYGVALPRDGSGVFLTLPLTDQVIELDPSTGAQVGSPIAVGDFPQGIAFQPPAALPPPPTPAAARPIVTSVFPTSGPVAGGQRVTITGANFGSARAVLFGDTPAASLEVIGFNTIVAVAPPGRSGAVEVRVIGPGGEGTRVGTYLYEALPTATAIAAPEPAAPAAPAPCVVPDVRGLTLPAARTRLRAAHCIVGTVSRVRGARHQRVRRQAIVPGTRKPHGWGVALALRPRR